MANFNNFNDIRKYIEDSIRNLQLPDHYKGQICVYADSLIPTGLTYLGTPSKILKTFEAGCNWLVGDTKTVYIYTGTEWELKGTLNDPWNGDFYFIEWYLENNETKITKQVQANITYNGTTLGWDVAKDLFSQPDEEYVITDGITGQISVHNKLKSYQDAISDLGTTNTINFIVQKTNGTVGVEKRTLSGAGFIKVTDGVLSVDTTSYISVLNVDGGTAEEGEYVDSLSVLGNTFTVTKKALPTPPTLEDLEGQPKNDLLDVLSSFAPSINGFLGITYNPSGTTPEEKWELDLSDQLVTNDSLATTLTGYQPKHSTLTKISATPVAMTNGNDYVLNLHQNSATVGDFTVTVDNRTNLINFGTDLGGGSGVNKFLSDLTKDVNGRLVRTYTSALTSLTMVDAANEVGKALTGVTYSSGTLTFVKQTFLQQILKGTVSGSGNVITDISIDGTNKINLTKGIVALTAITKPMVEEVLTGTITSHDHNEIYDYYGSAEAAEAAAIQTAKEYTDDEIESFANKLLNSGNATYNKLVDIITQKVNEMITAGQFPDFEDNWE